MHSRTPDLAWLLARYGYAFSEKARRRSGAGSPSRSPALPVRLLGRPAVLLGGPEGVRTFTDTKRVARHGATPPALSDVLFGRGAVHGLDNEAHRRRKELFANALDAAAVDDLVTRVGRSWACRIRDVRDGDQMLVQDTAEQIIGKVVLQWAGLDLPANTAVDATEWFATIVDGFGVLGPAHLRARRARSRSNALSADLVTRVRTGELAVPEGSAAGLVSRWTEEDGRLLPAEVAGVELQNVLRPTVAVSRLVAFAALALTGHPEWRETLVAEHERGESPLRAGVRGSQATAFAREVRRLAPFVPLLAGRSRSDQVLLGTTVHAGAPVLLDVVGTLRDPDPWPDPLSFDPSRFLGGQRVMADALVPQGGGSVTDGHRCPGEDPALGILTCASTALALVADRVLGRRRVDERRIPASPPGGVRLRLRRSHSVE